MNYISFRIAGKNLDFNKINQMLKETHPICHREGEKKYIRGEEIIFKEDIWQLKREVDDVHLNEEIEKIVLCLDLVSEYIRNLTLKNAVSFWVTIYPESIQQNIHLSSSLITKLHGMNVDLDLSIMDTREF